MALQINRRTIRWHLATLQAVGDHNKKVWARVVAVAIVLTLLGLSACDHRASSDVDSVSKSQLSVKESQLEASQFSRSDATVQADISSIVDVPISANGLSIRWPYAKLSTPGRIQPVAQRAGDPVAGRRALLEESYVSCGLPERVYRNVTAGIPVTEIAGRHQNTDGLPYSTNLIVNHLGVPIVTNNCLTCHGTVLFGELVVGLGNEFLDFTQDASALVERAGLLVADEAESLSWELYADRIALISRYTQTHTVGVNPANNLTFALIAHRDAASNAWSDEPLLAMPPMDPPPVSVPPWWRMQKKPAMFNLGEGRGDHARIMMAASMLCADTEIELDEIDEYAPDLLAYIKSLEPPVWPFAVNQQLAESGQTLFENTCSVCHGTYGDSPEYPARLVPIDVVQTDATLVNFALNDGLPYVDWFNRSYYGRLSTAAPGPGYVAPPLDGVWATAPFLHNGSVPSLRAVLNQKSRPVVWRHKVPNANQRDSYDQDDMGWDFDVVENRGGVEQKSPNVYDTRLPGYGNSGHPFGDHLSDAQRDAVLEYLKTL